MRTKQPSERVLLLAFTLLALLSAPVLASNDELIAAGEQQAMVCKACHQFEPNGVTVVGPPLWGLAERNIASLRASITATELDNIKESGTLKSWTHFYPLRMTSRQEPTWSSLA